MEVAIIGCGAIARRVHIPAFRSISDVHIKSVVDKDEKLAAKVAREFNIGVYYSEYQQALNDEKVELVSICTPSFTHADMIAQAARMGKHVLVEKPLAISLDEGKTAVNIAKENNVKLCVIFNYRFFPAVRRAYAKIKSRKLGRVVSMIGIGHTPFPISWTRSVWPYHYGGVLDDFGPHIIDLLLWLNPSKVDTVSAQGGDFSGNFGFLSHVQVALKFEDTSVGVADLSWLSDLFVVSFDVYGTAGRLSCDVRNNHCAETHGQMLSPMDELTSATRKSLTMIKSTLSGTYFRGSLVYHRQIIRDFIDSIRKGGKPPITGEEALLRTAVSSAAKTSLSKGEAVRIDDLLKGKL